MNSLSIEEARRILGTALIGPAELARLLGGSGSSNSDLPIPFSASELEAAKKQDCILIRRPVATADGERLTLAFLHTRFAETLPTGGRGFRAGKPWFGREDFATEEVPAGGWALTARVPWQATLNQTYVPGGEAIQLEAKLARLPEGWRRRSAVEAAFDSLALAAATGSRPMETAWDWCSTASADGGLVNIGGFTADGLEVLAYSRAVKHGGLGACPTLVRG
jgi:hypothetical protein